MNNDDKINMGCIGLFVIIGLVILSSNLFLDCKYLVWQPVANTPARCLIER